MAENKKAEEKSEKSGWWECTMKKGADEGETRVYHHTTAKPLQKKGFLKMDKELDKYVPAYAEK